MSFVSVVGGVNFLSVMTDGRVSNGETILEETYPKFRMIGEDIVVAFTGDRMACERLFDALNKEVIAHQDFFKTACDIKEAFNRYPIFRGKKVMWVIGGINPNKKIEFVIVSTESDEPSQYIPENSETKLMSAYAFCLKDTSIDYKQLNEKLDEYFKQENGNLIEAQKLLNNYVAELDFTVNTNTYPAFISNPQ
ncbi:hypothetical protein [Bacillus paramycoides]|uniref:hypothetical protein n=1 Tax=Bacillus paramycoides TaxID=2026194 RepID=UPI002E1A1C4C|nr:hypothetical protein [Bacillus paramycoides]